MKSLTPPAKTLLYQHSGIYRAPWIAAWNSHRMEAPNEGFNRRLLDALEANGLPPTAETLAQIAHVTLSVAQLMLGDKPYPVDAITLFRIADRLRFSSRWLVFGTGSPIMRKHLSPDEDWMIDRYRAMSPSERAVIHHAIKNLV